MKYVVFEYRPIFQKPVEMWKFFLQKTDKSISYQELEKTNTGRLSAKVAINQFDRTHCDDWLQNVLFLCRF